MRASGGTRSSPSCATGPPPEDAPLSRPNVRDVSSPESTRMALSAPAWSWMVDS